MAASRAAFVEFAVPVAVRREMTIVDSTPLLSADAIPLSCLAVASWLVGFLAAAALGQTIVAVMKKTLATIVTNKQAVVRSFFIIVSLIRMAKVGALRC